jgi:hypothetical protein
LSLRRADPRFALPRPVRRAVVLGELDSWQDGLREAGIEASSGGTRPELVVAPAALAGKALSLAPEMLVLEGGRPERGLAAAGWATRVLLPLPDAARPELLIAAGQGNAARYAVRHWRPGATRRARARNALARELIARGIVPPGRAPTTVAARSDRPPFPVAAALETLPSDDVRWFAAFGAWAHPFSRGAFYLFPRAAREPAWVVKFARMPGLEPLFDQDEQGLRLAERTGGVVAAHAPRLVARFGLDGLHASTETAATGERLGTVLGSTRPREERLADLGRVAEWIVRVAHETVAPPEALEAERRRLATDVVPRWTEQGLPATLVDDLPPVAAVFQHGDVWDNVFLRRDGFTVIDWESAREHGMPLWDMLYLLTGALSVVDGLGSEEERDEYFARLWRGELPSSEVLFHWTRAAVEATAVPVEAVGPLATLLWLSYALLDAEHVARVEIVEGATRAIEPATQRFARRWLSDPALGPGWDRWRR